MRDKIMPEFRDEAVRRMAVKTDSVRSDLFRFLVAKILQFDSVDEALEDSTVSLIDIDNNLIYSVFTGAKFPTNGLDSSGKEYDELVQVVAQKSINPAYEKVYCSYMNRDNMRKQYESGNVFNSCEYLSRRGNNYKWMYSSYSLEKDYRTGRLFCYLLIFEYDHYRRAQEEMMNMALRDQLTNLYNRYKLESELNDYFENNKDKTAVLIAFDLNKFKEINDSYGHQTGDRALLAMAERMQKCFYNRNSDYLFREGGDEFLVFLENTTEEVAVNKIVSMLEEPIAITSDNGDLIEFTASAGYTVLKPEDSSVDELIKRADNALYFVKEHGRKGFISM